MDVVETSSVLFWVPPGNESSPACPQRKDKHEQTPRLRHLGWQPLVRRGSRRIQGKPYVNFINVKQLIEEQRLLISEWK